jgi:HSP20 family protein
MQGELDKLFDSFFAAGPNRRERRWVPATDLLETKDHFILRADLPGVKEEDVAVEIKDGFLTVNGERKEEHAENPEGYYRFERVHGAFARSLPLPDGIDPSDVNATFERGVLGFASPSPLSASRIASRSAATGSTSRSRVRPRRSPRTPKAT